MQSFVQLGYSLWGTVELKSSDFLWEKLISPSAFVMLETPEDLFPLFTTKMTLYSEMLTPSILNEKHCKGI